MIGPAVAVGLCGVAATLLAVASTPWKRAMWLGVMLSVLGVVAVASSLMPVAVVAMLVALAGPFTGPWWVRVGWWLAMVGLVVGGALARNRVLFETTACGSADLMPARARPAGDFPYQRWGPPAEPALHLVDLAGEVEGGVPAASGLLARWTAADLGAWRQEAVEGGQRFTSPPLDPPLREVARVHISARTDGAARLVLVPSSESTVSDRARLQQTVPVRLAPGETSEVVVDVGEVLRGNWESATDGLAVLELTFEGAGAGAALDEVGLEAAAARTAQPAGVLVAEREGVLRPSWYVHGGSRVRLDVAVPAGGPLLRWSDSGTGGPRRVSVIDGAVITPLNWSEGQRPWRNRQVSLAPWAGRTVRVELAADGDGVAFFGEPTATGVATGLAPDVVVYLVDTLRADHVGAWGRGDTPAMDRLASEGTTFGLALSASPWTKPSVTTLLTGLWPTTHRIGATSTTDRLPATVPLLPAAFRAAGWRTGSFSANPLGSTLTGLERGFDTTMPPRRWGIDREAGVAPTAAEVHREVLTWWVDQSDRPRFAYVHVMDVHEYHQASNGRLSPQAYGEAISALDAELGELVNDLRSRSENLLFVLVSDHGESFSDHGSPGHGTALWQSQVHVPLVFWGGVPAAAIPQPVSLADVAPTIADLVGLPPLAGAEGVSLRGLVDGGSEVVHDFVPSALLRSPRDPGLGRSWSVVGANLHKRVRREGEGDLTFDLSADLCEGRATEGDLEGVLDGWLAEQETAAARFRETHGTAERLVHAADLQRLKALGYIAE